MLIKFTEDTHIRTEIGSPKTLPIGVVYRGSVIEVEDKVYKGFVIERIDQWYRDQNGWFYWVGSSEIVSEDHFGIAVRFDGGLDLAEKPLSPAFQKTKTAGKTDPDLEIFSGEETATQAKSGHARQSKTTARKAETVTRRRLELESFQEKTAVSEPPAEPLAEPEKSSPRKKNLVFEPEKLNWGAKNYLIAKDWWQENGLTGRGTRLCLLGTGAVFGHPDLEGAVAERFSVFGNEDDANDFDGLGTQTAVVAAGRGNSVFGIAPETSLLIGKIGNHEPDCRPETLVAGLDWAMDSGADIVVANMDAFGISEEEKEAIRQITQKALERGVFLLCPVGNSVEKRPEDRFPAAIEGWFSVGACDLYGRRCAWSAKSYHLDLLAPGESLLTSNLQFQAVSNSKNTAIAASFAAALLALMLQKFRESGQKFDPKTLLELLRETAIPNKAITKGSDTEYGFGILNPPEILNRFLKKTL